MRHNEASFNSTKWRCPYDNVTYCKFTQNRKQLLPPPLHMARTWMDMHRLRRLHDSQYIMKNPFTNENSNLSNIFHNNIHRKKVESLKVRSTEKFLCQFGLLPCRFFRGRRQGRQPLNPGAGPGPVALPEAFGGNRRLYTLAAPAGDPPPVDSAPPPVHDYRCNLQCILRVVFKKHRFLQGFVAFAVSRFHLGDMQKLWVFHGFGSSDGVRNGKLHILTALMST